ncbi:phosphoribosylformylglycinamidine synthase subunit PurQ [Corynebacterium liangguodongii]|uniref:Phosphoribosylformylglycinamidine synthase subunit PurQ n=1 Tax=Corynebacterium liangguodongii TaxID=2079535 RepID=A0A2S0WFT1_9CORY|nr:phosphoribosylformylglycinamidine synthase subunit PurQ [Corynebacterium liangguodongii]AWB84619.1 phosphoribosylformylglycinamidine synthase subunit PurQ [Corynebacterium liangguodongii]PWB99627.1 phosphoribosylformylglycinamidine synthase subunit PurQ [Corynebacterium liangguodongii]
MSATIGVITFPGTLDDVDAQRAVRVAGAEPKALWHADDDLTGVDAVIVPGGFSYGDYLRSGAIAAQAPMMGAVVEAAKKGMPVLGICNGFQILTEAGLLPGALTRNENLLFHCVDTHLVVENNSTAWTSNFEPGEKIFVPAKHGEGRFQAAPETVERLEKEGRVVFRYTENFNGSANAIAGVTNETGRVVGLMPHPEHAVELLTGPSTDGLGLFLSAISTIGA